MYYVYAYLREQDNRPYYVGKGSGNRAFSKTHNVTVPNNRNQIVFWHENLEENEALELEMFYINMFGRKDICTGVLYNRTNGGDGASGLQHSDKYKERLRQQALGNSGNFGGGDNPRLGVTLSEETKAKMSKAAKGRKPPQSAIDASSLEWIVTSPEGDEYKVKSLRGFCEGKDVNYKNIHKRGHSKGWKAEKLQGV